MGTVEMSEDWTHARPILLNPAATASFGPRHPDPLSEDFSSVSLTERWLQRYQQAYYSKEPVLYHSIPEDSIEGSPMQYSLSYMMYIGQNRFSFISQDITHLKNMEAELIKGKEELENTIKKRTKELEDALQVKSRFLAIMSHGKETELI